jgi:hypothetical protein
LVPHLFHLAEAFFLETRVANRQHFIDNQNLWLQMRGNRKCQSNEHATGVALDGCIYELLDLGERNYFVELAVNLGFFHPQYSAVEVNIFPAAELAMKAGAHFQKTSDSPVKVGFAFGRNGDSRKDFEQSAFTGAVSADHPD